MYYLVSPFSMFRTLEEIPSKFVNFRINGIRNFKHMHDVERKAIKGGFDKGGSTRKG